MNDIKKVTRLEVIDHTDCKRCKGKGWLLNGRPVDIRLHKGARPEECSNCGGMGTPGRTMVFWDKDKTVELSFQDDGRTLKVFIGYRKDAKPDAQSIGRMALVN